VKKALLFLPFLLFAGVNNSFYNSGNTGWFFNEYNETNETNKTSPAKINPYNVKALMKLPDNKFMHSIPLDNLNLYTADGFKKVFKRAKGIAVMHPTRYNVYVVKKMQKFMTDQATKFAKVWYVETLQNPTLEYPGINPASFARTASFYAQQKKYKEFFTKHKNDIGFVVFYNPKDKMATTRQHWTFNQFKKDYPGYTIVWIDITKRPDLVRKFKIKTTPDNFYVYKNKKGEAVWVRIKAGLMSESELLSNTIFTFNNIIAPKDK